ncbi:hypothetical protein H9P43_008379 [Blastocladiella emersonii ATCC 22665]|nr:hypothetical protein H9P43_008379 [Blastocladiella emersonii ATCC 22665]
MQRPSHLVRASSSGTNSSSASFSSSPTGGSARPLVLANHTTASSPSLSASPSSPAAAASFSSLDRATPAVVVAVPPPAPPAHTHHRPNSPDAHVVEAGAAAAVAAATTARQPTSRHSRTASLVSLARRATHSHSRSRLLQTHPLPTSPSQSPKHLPMTLADPPALSPSASPASPAPRQVVLPSPATHASPNSVAPQTTPQPMSLSAAHPLGIEIPGAVPGVTVISAAPTPAAYNAATLGRVLRDKTHLFLSTQRTQYRSRLVTVRTGRFLLRVLQLVIGCVALVALYAATFGVNYTSTSIGVSGINLASLTCVTSVVVSFTHIFNLLWPKLVGIAPSAEAEYSPVEMALDTVYMLLWGLSASMQAANGSCPRYLFNFANSPEAALYNRLSAAEKSRLLAVDCLPWNLSWAFGYVAAITYGWSAFRGLRAWRKVRATEDLIFI